MICLIVPLHPSGPSFRDPGGQARLVPFASVSWVQASQTWLSSTAVAAICSPSVSHCYGSLKYTHFSAIPNSLPNDLLEHKPRHVTHLLKNLLRFLLPSGSLQLLWQSRPFTTGAHWPVVSLAIFSLLGFQQVGVTSTDLMVPLPLYSCPCCFFP